MIRDLEIDLLRSFVAVAAQRNFTQAGLSINRTQSAVSLQIKRLEDIVGKRLFERNRQSVSITPTGEILLVYAKRILTANDVALSHIRRPEADGLIRIGTPDDYATYLLPPILSAISKDHPRLQFEVTCENGCDLLKLLDQGQLDVAVVTHPTNDISRQVARYEQLHWVASPDYAEDPEAQLSLVLFPTGCICRNIVLDTLEKINRSWFVSYNTRSIGLIEKAILKDGCVSVMEASIIPDTLKIIDGRTGFPPLPDVAISVHTAKSVEPHVALVSGVLLTQLGCTT